MAPRVPGPGTVSQLVPHVGWEKGVCLPATLGVILQSPRCLQTASVFTERPRTLSGMTQHWSSAVTASSDGLASREMGQVFCSRPYSMTGLSVLASDLGSLF